MPQVYSLKNMVVNFRKKIIIWFKSWFFKQFKCPLINIAVDFRNKNIIWFKSYFLKQFKCPLKILSLILEKNHNMI